jgi:hypothetical protein
VHGNLNRRGDQSATGSGPTTGCSKPIPTTPDCGDRPLPLGTTIGLEWRTPHDWAATGGPAPLVQSLSLSGPVAPSGGSAMTYANCVGVNFDYMLGVSEDTSGYESGFGGLPRSELFGRRRHFDVTGVLNKHVTNPNPTGVTGTWETKTSTQWKVRFVRLAHPGRRPQPVHPAPLS